jgi:LAGLIDADG endonuclease
LDLLLKLKEFFGGVGSITKQGRNCFQYRVSSVKDLVLIIEHFDIYQLITQKKADFEIFKKVFNIIKNKNHLTNEGLQQIINLRASMNIGLSDNLKFQFSKITPVERPNVCTKIIPDPNWIAGFVNGDGCFEVIIQKSKNKIGFQIRLKFSITQHERDIKLMKLLIKYLEAGSLYKKSNAAAIDLTITNFSLITKTIIPLFKTNQLQGIKRLDYID